MPMSASDAKREPEVDPRWPISAAVALLQKQSENMIA